MTDLTMQFHVYSCHFCNKALLMLRFGPVKALRMLTSILLKARAFLGQIILCYLFYRGVSYYNCDSWTLDSRLLVADTVISVITCYTQ